MKGSEQERQNTFQNFNDKYCSFVYSGKFSAGGYLGTAATARCFDPTEGQDSKYAEKCATEETERWWSGENQTNPSSGNKSANVRMNIVKANNPLKIQNINELKNKIENVKDCTVFPANWDDKSQFTPVYEIMQSQAEENNDEELRKVSEIFKECMKEICDIVTDREGDDSSPKMSTDVKGKNCF